MTKKVQYFTKIIFYTPIYLFSLLVLLTLVAATLTLFDRLVYPLSTIKMIELITLSFLIPLISAFQKEKNSLWYKQKDSKYKAITLIILVPVFFIIRILMVGYIIGGERFISNLIVPSWLAALLFILSDAIFWKYAFNLKRGKKEPYIYFLIKASFIEAFLLATIYIVVQGTSLLIR